MKRPEGQTALLEEETLRRWNLPASAFERFADLTAGTRRALMVRVGDLEWRSQGADLLLQFSLPAGAYATSVVREFVKEPGTDSADRVDGSE